MNRCHLLIRGAIGVVSEVAARQVAVGPVAERPCAGLLAAAEDDVLVALGFKGNRQEFGSRMRAVTERLRLGASRANPQVALARLNLMIKPFAMRDDGRGFDAIHRVSRNTPSAPRRSEWSAGSGADMPIPLFRPWIESYNGRARALTGGT